MLRKDHVGHILYGLGIMAVVALLFSLPMLLGVHLPGPLTCGMVAGIAVFYGREERDHEIKACAARHCNIEALTWRDYLPWRWCRDGRWDVFCPVVGCLTAYAVVLALLWWRGSV